MKIKKLEIYGYGKWVNQTFDFDDQFQIIYGPNEAGKSTVQSFIRSILFGFPSKRRRVHQINRYEPKQTDKYGGRLLLTETEFGDLWIERVGSNLMIQDTKGQVYDNSSLKQVLAGMDEKLFDTFYSFTLQNLQEIRNLDTDQINDYFLSIGNYGQDRFVKAVRQLQKEADDLYRPNGQSKPLNVALSDLEEVKKQLDRAKEKAATYHQLTIERDKLTNQIKEVSLNLKEVEEQLRQKDRLMTRYDTFLKDQAARRELEGLVYTEVAPDHPQRLKEANEQIESSQAELIKLQSRINQLQGELGTMTRLNWAVNHEAERKEWLLKTQEAKDKQAKIEYLQGRIGEQAELMRDLANRGHFSPDKVVSSSENELAMDHGIQLLAKEGELDKEIESVRSELNVYMSQRKNYQAYVAQTRSNIAKLENIRLNEEARLVEETSLKHYFVGLLMILLGIGLMITYFTDLGSQSRFILLMGVGLIGIGAGASVYVAIGHRQKIKDYYNSPILKQIQDFRDKEDDYQEQARLVTIEINDREEAIDRLETHKSQVIDQEKEWLMNLGYFETASIEMVLKTNPIQSYYEAKIAKLNFEKEVEELGQALVEWRALLQPLFERFPYEERNIRLQIRYVEEIESQLKVTQFRGENIQEKIEEAKSLQGDLKEKIEEANKLIEELLDLNHVESQQALQLKLMVNDRILELNKERALYLQQIEGFEEELNQVESKQVLGEEYKRLENQGQRFKEQLEPLHHQRANVEIQIRLIEQDGMYQKLSQEYENQSSQVKSLLKQWASKKLAADLIQSTLHKGYDNLIPSMVSRATEFFNTLSHGRYTKLFLNEKELKVVQFSDILFEPYELSQGTLEQLYVSLRLAFIESAKDLIKMPIMIDDAFVNFDHLRKESVYQVLKEVSKENQVLLFTFDQQIDDFLPDVSKVNLEDL